MMMAQSMPQDRTDIKFEEFELSSDSSQSSLSRSDSLDNDGSFAPLSASKNLSKTEEAHVGSFSLNMPIAKSFSHFTNSLLSASFRLPVFVTRPEAVVVVDPWSTGTRLCQEIVQRDIILIVLWNHNLIRSTTLPAKEVILHNKADYNSTVSQIKLLTQSIYDIKAIIPGSETGVLLAEQLSHSLNLPSNDLKLTQARRNKYLMGETLRLNNVRSVKQIITNDLTEALNFIKTQLYEPKDKDDLKVILKPNMGAGSDDVFLCKTFEEVNKNFNIINGKINSLGIQNDGVLVQEFLDGKEYVVDSVTKNGKHKIVGIWEYDKREVNGRFNIYFGNFPLVKNNNKNNIVIELEKYIFEVLNSLDFKNGPSHAEIKITKRGPVLVEVGARCHGGGGTWVDVAKEVWGFDQIGHLIDSLDLNIQNKNIFEKFHNESFPNKFKKFGCVLDFVGYETGEILFIPGENISKELKSFYKIELFKKIGDKLEVTVDCNTSPGQLILIHESEEQVRKDFDTIHTLLKDKDKFFVLKR